MDLNVCLLSRQCFEESNGSPECPNMTGGRPQANGATLWLLIILEETSKHWQPSRKYLLAVQQGCDSDTD